MAYAFPSLLTRHTLRSGVHNSFPQLKQLFPRHETFSGALKTTPHSLQRCFHSSQSSVIRAVREIGPKEKGGITFWLQGATIAGVGLSLANLRSPVVHCDALEPQVKSAPSTYHDERGPLPSSSVSLYELSFGTVAGICAGVFTKKGAKALAFLFGGVFVLLQYLGSVSLVRVDWGRAATKFENVLHTKDTKTGVSRPPNVVGLFNWLVNFLTADFQPRASFIAGFVLGLRLG